MNPAKIAGGCFVLLGFVFRWISVAVFRQRAKRPGAKVKAKSLFGLTPEQRSYLIDVGFIVLGFYLILAH